MTTRDPLQPSTAYLDATARLIENKRRAVRAPEPVADDYERQKEYWEEVSASVDKYEECLVELARDLHEHPEVAFEEYRSASQIAAFLRRYDHEVTEGAHGLETALRSEWSSPDFIEGVHPTIAVMSEYDALPEIGHACGHNLIAASGVGAYLAAVETLQKSGLAARVVFFGTPAEEGHSGKEYMIRAGMLDGVDAAVMMHPFSFDIASHVWVGRRAMTATFTGISAHASSQPFMGRNALDAASLAYQGMGLLRQQMPPSDRLHAVISDGGDRPSVVPDHAKLDIYVRSTLAATLMDLSARVDEILDGAALMAGVSVEKNWDIHPMSLPVRNNEALAARWQLTQSKRGRTALPAGVVPQTLAASTDFGNVSHLVPAIHPMVKIAPEGVALHTREFEKRSDTAAEPAVSGLIDAAIGLAQVIVDLVADPELLKKARAEFAQAGGPVSSSQLLDSYQK